MDAQTHRRLSGSLTTFKIVVMVMAAVAPMGAVVGVVPLAIAIGSGASTPAVFAIAGLALLCFAVGYSAMSKRISAAGGFYTDVARGLGRPPAMAAAALAVIAYNAMTLLLIAGVGYFGNLVLFLLTDITISWWVIAGAAIAVVGFLGIREIAIAGTVLLVLLGIEMMVLVSLDIAIVLDKGLDAFPTASMDPTNVLSTGSIGLGLMFAFTTFLGFESAAIYAEEANDAARSVSRAAFIAVFVIASFYVLTTWITIGALGVDQAQSSAGQQLGTLYFGLSDQFLSSALTKLMQVTMVTSLFASMLAMHNAASRYMYAVGRERALLPGWIGKLSSFGTPARASAVQTTISALVVSIFALGKLDPYRNMGTIMTGIGTLGLILLQAMAATAILRYFWRRGERPVAVLIGTSIGLAAFVTAAVLILKNFETLAGSTSTLVHSLPWLLLATAVASTFWALRLRAASPAAYARIGSFGEGSSQEDPGDLIASAAQG